MCGIYGYICKTGFRLNQADEENFDKLSNLLSHRGPDDKGSFKSENNKIFFGHNRLSILDLSKQGHQPMFSKNKNFLITFNGEIYNHIDLRKKLATSNNVVWQSNSDTETLLNFIEVYGIEETLKNISGMYSFALWDIQNKSFYLCRDNFGEKPLYFGFDEQKLVFGSELKIFQHTKSFKKKICLEALKMYTYLSYIPHPYSIYKNIYKLPPGSYLKFNDNFQKINKFQEFDKVSYDNHNIELKYYTSVYDNLIKNKKKKITEEEAVYEVEKLLEASVSKQLISDRPVGVFLSGGIDSSLVAAILNKKLKKNIKTFSITFDEPEYDESFYSENISKIINSHHISELVTHEDLLNCVNNIHKYYDEPFADSSQIPTKILCDKSKKYVDVVLTGDGADEIFGGYIRYLYILKLYNFLRYVPNFVLKILSKILLYLSKFNFLRIFKNRFHFSSDRIYKLAIRLKKFNSPIKFYYSMLIEQYEFKIMNYDGFKIENFFSKFEKKMNFLDMIMYIDQKLYLSDDILCKVDRAAMSASLETRVPYLDIELVKYAGSLSSQLKIKNFKTKYILRKILEKYIPKKFIDRKKMGFGIPLSKWFRGPIKQWAYEALFNYSQKHNFFDQKKLFDLWNDHQNLKRDNSSKLWLIIMFNLWYQKQEQFL